MPDGYRFFRQPSGLSPNAENIPFLPGGREYYRRQLAGKSEDWIKVYILGEYGYVGNDRPVYPEFRQGVHVVDHVQPLRGLPLIVGLDYGLTPAATINQLTPKGQFRTLAEVVSFDMGIRRFLRDRLKPVLATEFPGMQVLCYGDPAGTQKSQTDETTCHDEVIQAGLRLFEPPTNAFVPRREAVAHYLTSMVDGEPGYIVDRGCRWLIKGMSGKYCYRRMQVPGTERYTDKPDKNDFSHVAESLQYAALGAKTVSLPDLADIAEVPNRLL